MICYQISSVDYNPDNWVILKIKPVKSADPLYKVLAGCSQGDSWRMNSGITRVEKQAQLYGFYGSSGSVYWCHQGSYGLRMNGVDIYNELKERHRDIQLMPEDTNWLEIKW
jgi:DUF1365 family protein